MTMIATDVRSPRSRPLGSLMLVVLLCASAARGASDLPRPPALEPAVAFWTRIYTEVSTSEGLLHDRNNLSVVYEKLQLQNGYRHPARERRIRRRRAHYRQILNTLARGKRNNLSAEQESVLALWPDDVSNQRLRRAANGIRFQLGQSDKFRQGLIRAGAWEPHMRDILARMDLPPELAALPHVESSFNPDAYSRLGAAGIWQFTRLTGRRFMRVDHIVDERMDPFAATEAAGRLLKQNYSVTGDWGLAITAYNHGLAGIRRAAQSVGSNNIGDIIERYDGRRWGFASRNFYPSFLAAVEVERNAPGHFGEIKPRAPLITDTVTLPFYTTVDAVLDAHPVSRSALRELNRGLRAPVWQGQKYIPRGYDLRLPAGTGQPEPAVVVERIGDQQRYAQQVPDVEHTIRRGQSLSEIARRYGTSVRELMAMNNLRSVHHIRAGETLRLPVDGEGAIMGDSYQVSPGDSLSEIARRAGLETKQLARLNNLDPDAPLQTGELLRISAGETGETAPPGAPDQMTAEQRRASKRVTVPLAPAPPPLGDRDPVATLVQQISALTLPAEEADKEQRPRIARASPTSATAVSAPDARADLAADPSDYSVADDNTITIQAAETLGHYAEWLELRASDLRRGNNLRYGEPLVMGERLQMDFNEVEPKAFEQRRRSYHRDLQAAFFERHHIRGSEDYRIERGDSLWNLTRPATDIPVWLLRQYNPDRDFTRLKPGDVIQMPVIEEQGSGPVIKQGSRS